MQAATPEAEQAPNALQVLLGFDPETGAYRRSFLLRRLAQLAIAQDRGISNAEIARRAGVTREQIRLYFLGTTGRRGAQALEERVERALESFSRENSLSPGPVTERRFIPDIVTKDLMKAPPHGGYAHGRRGRRGLQGPRPIEKEAR